MFECLHTVGKIKGTCYFQGPSIFQKTAFATLLEASLPFSEDPRSYVTSTEPFIIQHHIFFLS